MDKIKYSSVVTIYGCSYSIAHELVKKYNDSSSSSINAEDTISKHGIRCLELDKISQMYIDKLDSILAKMWRKPPEWVDLSESHEEIEKVLIEEAFLSEYFIKTKYDASVLIPVFKNKLLFEWDIVNKYGWHCLSLINDNMFKSQRLQIIVKAHPYREAAEKINKLGLAKRGKEIDINTILEKLTIDQLKIVLTDFNYSQSTKKKQDYINLIISQSDAVERIQRIYLFEDMFLFSNTFTEMTTESLNDSLIYYKYCSEVDKYLMNASIANTEPLKLSWIDKSNNNIPEITDFH